MHIFTGNQPYLSYPPAMGRELSGTVGEPPPGSPLAAGDPVYLMYYLSCRHCSACRKGKTNCWSQPALIPPQESPGEFL